MLDVSGVRFGKAQARRVGNVSLDVHDDELPSRVLTQSDTDRLIVRVFNLNRHKAEQG
jgi:hypothetical protein